MLIQLTKARQANRMELLFLDQRVRDSFRGYPKVRYLCLRLVLVAEIFPVAVHLQLVSLHLEKKYHMGGIIRRSLIYKCLIDFILKYNIFHNLPVFVPPVKIHAPVVFAAFSRPLRKTFFSAGCSSKLERPPCTVMSSFGKPKFHSRHNSWTMGSGFVSWANLTY